MTGHLLSIALAMGLAVIAHGAMAETAAARPSLGAYGRLPAVELARLSPSGARFVLVTVVHDQRALVVRETTGKNLLSMPVGTVKVRDLRWAGEDHLLITVSRVQFVYGTRTRGEYPFTLSIDLRTGRSLGVFGKNDHLLPYTFAYHGAFESSGHLYGRFVGGALSGERGFETYLTDDYNLYRVDLDSGEAALLVRGRGRSEHWVLGPGGGVMAHSEYDPSHSEWRLMADTPEARELFRISDPLAGYDLIGPGRAPGTVIVSHGDVDEWSLASGVKARIALDGDPVAFAYDYDKQRVLGVWVGGDDPHLQIFDPKFQARFTGVRRAIPGRLSPVTWTDDYQRMVVFAEGDGDAGTYWLIDGKTASPIGYAYPDLPDAAVGKESVVAYKAADGLEIHAILTLPPGRAAEKLPLIVLPHGGPEAQDSLAFDWWAQAFASQGYAVLQPNFRGSSGYGQTFRDAGFGQWGRKMQTDVSDGVAAMAAQGVIDPSRVCIVGASYGGYAALAGVTLQHGIYRCAVSVAGVSNLSYLLSEHTWENGDDAANAGTRYLRRFLGVTSDDDQTLQELSPVRLAARADAPILLIHGTDDTVVPLRQSRDMEAALRRAGKPVDFVLLPGEDHWLSQEATRKAMLEATMKFVELHNPPS